MNPRVSRSSRAGVEGDRVPDRQDRGQARGRLHARRDPQRHHQGHAGELRADHRLRRHQGAAVGVREVPGHARRARDVDAVGGRGDGHRPHVPRVAAEGAALARARPRGLNCDPGERALDEPRRRGAARRGPRSARRTGRSSSRPRCGAASRWSVLAERDEGRPVVPRPDPRRSSRSGPSSPSVGLRRRCTRAELAAGQAPRLLRRAARLAVGRRPRPTVRAARVAAGVRATFKTVDTCAAEFEAATPYHYSTYEDEDEVAPLRTHEGAHPRLGPEPHRAGHRVRLLLRARQLRPAPTPASRR